MTHGTVHGMTHGTAHGTIHGILLGTMAVAATHATIITGTTLGITDAITATHTDLGDLMIRTTLVIIIMTRTTLVIITKPTTSQEVQEADMKDITVEAALVREQVQMVQVRTEIPTDHRPQRDRAAIQIKTVIPTIMAVPAITTEPISQQPTLKIPLTTITSVVPTQTQIWALTLTAVSTHPTTEPVRQQ